MFKSKFFIGNSFNLVIPRQETIRRLANEFEDLLSGKYFQPQIISVPDSLDPQIPRIIFPSEHGFSQITISQVSIALNVNYSKEWQQDISKGREYLKDRASILFELLGPLGNIKPNFCGMSSKAQLVSDQDDQAIIGLLVDKYLKGVGREELHDVMIKMTNVIEDRFFCNLTITNFRAWEASQDVTGVQSFSIKDAVDRGVEIVSDFNDRHSFNEKQGYESNVACATEIIDKGIDLLQAEIDSIEREER